MIVITFVTDETTRKFDVENLDGFDFQVIHYIRLLLMVIH
ncbi:Uncharacterised protein [Budvicia aquatica]|uniref:Uncharacterized protein n=1 Tax=Budvicia aquatica TaxID=82979 RepID=A0A485A531_9GAMM|nr:Uncharacterised protein [Budvicia aquatica]